MTDRLPGSPAGTLRRRICALLCATALWALLPAPWAGQAGATVPSYNWLQFGGDASHSGDNTAESIVGRATVGGLHRIFQASLPAYADGAPVALANVDTPSGTRDLLFLTLSNGTIVALDAHTGSQVWNRPNPPGSCHVNNGPLPCYTTSSPAIDPNGKYVYSYGLDGNVHKYAVGDGTETTGGGWPELASLKPFDEKGSSALSIATAANGVTYLYVTNGGYPGDRGDYQGHITAVNIGDGSQHVFNMACSDRSDTHFVERPGTPACGNVESAVWARAGVVYDAVTDRIYAATGNGLFDPAAHSWGDTVLALHPDGTGVAGGPLDSYTPVNQKQLDIADLDLGSSAPAILPGSAPAGERRAVQAGKDGRLQLINLANLSRRGGPGNLGGEIEAGIPVPQTGQVLTQPAVWVDPDTGASWVFVANGAGVIGFQLRVNSGLGSLQPMWTSRQGGASPLIANDVIYLAATGSIRALDPRSGAILWSDGGIGTIHWQSPVVVNGTLYIADSSGKLTAYALSTPPTPTPSATATPSSTATVTLTPTATALPPTPAPTSTPLPSPTPRATAAHSKRPKSCLRKGKAHARCIKHRKRHKP